MRGRRSWCDVRALTTRTLMMGAFLIGAATAVAQPSPTAITDRLRTKYLRPIDFHAAIFPDTVWVGQQATYQVAVLLNADARSRLRRNPEFLPPELRGLLAYELGTPQRVPPRSYGTDTYEAHVFQRALFAVAPGTVVVPAPQLTYSLPQSASYFSREERYTVSAESIKVVVKALPEAGRPSDFSGAIGTFRLSTKLDATTARMGDPLLLTVRVEGIGNVKLLPRPTVEASWASIVAGTERVQVDSSGAYIRGAKEFDYILTPAQAGAAVLPVVRYAYFDPFKGQYAIASSAPADLTIADAAMAGASDGSSAEANDADLLTLRDWRQRQAARLATLPDWLTLGALGLAVLLPLAALADGLQRRATQRASTTRDAERTLTREPATPEPATPESAARRIRRTLLAALAARLQVVTADLVARGDLQRVLRRRGVSRDTTREVLAFVDLLAEIGFGPARSQRVDDPDLERRANALLQRVASEAVPHGRTRLWSRRLRRAGSGLVLFGSLVGPAVGALLSGVPREARAQTPAAGNADVVDNSEATAAYNGRRFPRAAQRYAELVARRPDDVDLLVNWGTAAWAANDTVSAVVAWQRAARLDPLAPDIQERITLLPAGARTGIADVPMIPVLALAALALVAWVLGWGLWLWGGRRADARDGHAPGRVSAVVLLLVGLTAAGAAAWGTRALDDRALAVVRRPETMREGPSPDADPMGGAATGDVVKVVDVRQGWEQVVHADGRRGWIPAARLVSLANPLLDLDRSR